MAPLRLRTMKQEDFDRVAQLIHASTNAWYQARGCPAIFPGPPEVARLFCEVYEDLDPGCCILAEEESTGRLAGSCFYHPRPTHVSLGIMNVHPDFFGRSVGTRLLQFITDLADRQQKPVRLVSSAINLDSYSLYNRAGFVPRVVYQDMTLSVPEQGLAAPRPTGFDVRSAVLEDVSAMADLEESISGIRREGDFEYFVRNARGIWDTVVAEKDGRLCGFLSSVYHPGSNMLGPGVAVDQQAGVALLYEQLQRHRGRTPVWLVPAASREVVETMYRWGARNCELHFAQVRGAWRDPSGVTFPTFMPETG